MGIYTSGKNFGIKIYTLTMMMIVIHYLKENMI